MHSWPSVVENALRSMRALNFGIKFLFEFNILPHFGELTAAVAERPISLALSRVPRNSINLPKSLISSDLETRKSCSAQTKQKKTSQKSDKVSRFTVKSVISIRKQTNVSRKRPSLRNSSVLDLLHFKARRVTNLRWEKANKKNWLKSFFVSQLFSLFVHPKTSEMTSYQSSQFNYSKVIVFLQLEASSWRKANSEAQLFLRMRGGEALDTSFPSFPAFSHLSWLFDGMDSQILLWQGFSCLNLIGTSFGTLRAVLFQKTPVLSFKKILQTIKSSAVGRRRSLPAVQRLLALRSSFASQATGILRNKGRGRHVAAQEYSRLPGQTQLPAHNVFSQCLSSDCMFRLANETPLPAGMWMMRTWINKSTGRMGLSRVH